MAEDDLDAIRRRRLEELRRQQQREGLGDDYQRAVEDHQRQQQDAAREQLMRQILTPEARERLERMRMARPQDAQSLENQLIQLAQSGRLQSKIDDEQLKSILGRLQSGSRDISIRRK